MPSPLVIRWGSSPYERPEGLALEERLVAARGLRYRALPQGSPAQGLADATVLMVTSLTRVGATELAAAPGCRLLITTTSGYDHLDLDAAAARGVAVARMPLARRDAVAETALAMGLAMLRGLPALHHAAQQGHWARAGLPGLGMGLLSDEPVGLIGLGVIGRHMAGILRAFGCEVSGWDPAGLPPGIEATTPAAMVRRCRLVSLHCRLERGAAPVLDADTLRQARPDLLVVNTARGGVLDLSEARALLEEGRLGGLGLDVFPQEPWPDLGALASHPRVLLTPHAAGFHPRLHEAIAAELDAVLAAWLSDSPMPGRVV